MKKKILAGALSTLAGIGLCASVASAAPWDSLSSDYTVSTEMDYWSHTDLTTNVGGTSLFMLTVELAAYESNFGLYTIDNDNNIENTFEVFNTVDEPLSLNTVTFWDDGGDFKITDKYNAALDIDDAAQGWEEFDSNFGFYYEVVSAGYTFYTDSAFNTQDAGVEHITTAYNENTKGVFIYLEDLLSTDPNIDWDWQDMTVYGDDLQPVPEPATMLLFGAGLACLAGLARRKKA